MFPHQRHLRQVPTAARSGLRDHRCRRHPRAGPVHDDHRRAMPKPRPMSSTPDSAIAGRRSMHHPDMPRPWASASPWPEATPSSPSLTRRSPVPIGGKKTDAVAGRPVPGASYDLFRRTADNQQAWVATAASGPDGSVTWPAQPPAHLLRLRARRAGRVPPRRGPALRHGRRRSAGVLRVPRTAGHTFDGGRPGRAIPPAAQRLLPSTGSTPRPLVYLGDALVLAGWVFLLLRRQDQASAAMTASATLSVAASRLVRRYSSDRRSISGARGDEASSRRPADAVYEGFDPGEVVVADPVAGVKHGAFWSAATGSI